MPVHRAKEYRSNRSSLVIDHLQRVLPNCGIAHIYFNYMEQESQKPTQVLSSIIKQLVNQTLDLPGDIEVLYTRFQEHGKVPSLDELYSILLGVSSLFPRVIIVLDALDECHSEIQRRTLLPLFEKMGGDHTGISLFLTSRPHPEDIRDSLKNSVKVELFAHEQDIVTYVEEKINENPRVRRLIEQAKCRNRIISELVDCAKGMFLLVRFHIDFLCEQTSAREILTALGNIKASSTGGRPLDHTYDRAIETIRRQHRSSAELAFSVLSWLTHAKRTLTVEELRVALAVKKGDRELDKLSLREAETFLDVCASLVVLDEHRKTIMLAHYTVQEYLVKNNLLLADVEIEIATTCITYLSFDNLPHEACEDEESWVARLELYPFLEYAKSHVSAHLQVCNEDLTKDLLLEFLDRPCSVDLFTRIRYLQHEYPKSSPLHISCAIGHLAVTEILIREGANISATNFWLQTPLHCAAAGGHEAIAQLLLEGGADPSAADVVEGMTPLHYAANVGNEEITRLMLEHMADVSSADFNQQTPLHHAAMGAHLEVICLLLEGGAKVAAVERWFRNTPLHCAIDRGHEAVVTLLLGKGADISAANCWGLTPLHLAASKGYVSIISLLLENGANISAIDNQRQTPLHTAVIEGNEAVVPLLLKAIEEWGLTLLHEAVFRRDEEMIRLLLEAGIETTVTDKRGRTPFHEVALIGIGNLVPLLLDNTEFVLAIDNEGRTPLHEAALAGNETLVLMFLEIGADIAAVDSNGRTPLHDAALGGAETIISILLEKGADVLSVDQWGRTPLHEGTLRGSSDVVQALIKKGADISSTDKEGRTPLHTAIFEENDDAITILLENGADVSSVDKMGRTPFHEAAMGMCEHTFSILLNGGADISAVDNMGRTPLHCVCNGHLGRLVDVLLELGAEVSAMDNEGRTPLHDAVLRGDDDATFRLLKNGAKFSSIDKKGRKSLHEAALSCHNAVILRLVEWGADFSGVQLDEPHQERFQKTMEFIEKRRSKRL